MCGVKESIYKANVVLELSLWPQAVFLRRPMLLVMVVDELGVVRTTQHRFYF